MLFLMKQGVKVGGAVDSTNQGAVEKLSESQIVRHCSPTLAGMKTGSIFSGGYDRADELFDFLRRLNENLVPRGVRSVILRRSCQAALIYLYRPSQLMRDLTSPRAARMLGRYGYPLDCCDKCVVNLSSRLKTESDFPHEIGLFLGYPPEDVEGFITHNAEDFKLSGMWKVYGDVDDNGDINITDVLALRKYLAGQSASIHLRNADANADGDINVSDVLKLRGYLAGTGEELGKK